MEEEVLHKIGLGNRKLPRPRHDMIRCISPDQERRSWHSHWKVTYQARSEIRYLDINGSLLKGPKFATNDYESSPISIPVANIKDTPEHPAPRGNMVSRAPSLLEAVLNGCVRHPQASFLALHLHEDAPSYLPEILSRALVKKESGGSKCTICNRNFLVPRTEWIEWWEIAKVLDQGAAAASAASPLRQMENERDVLESRVPLMRRGCSWLCIPEKLVLVEDQAIDT